MNFQEILIKKEQHRAVAPIIATLLMVAISVVGGILIFVFAQGFFKDTSVQSPTIDALEIFGYFAEDVIVADFRMHTGDKVSCGVGAAVNQSLDDAECVALFVRNNGANPIIIQSVKMYGVEVTLKGTVGTFPAAGEHCLIVRLSVLCSGNSILEPGQEATILVSNDKVVINGIIKIGRPIIITVETGQGQVFTKQIRNGLSSGLTGELV